MWLTEAVNPRWSVPWQGGFFDQARYHQRSRQQNRHHQDKGRNGSGDGFRIDEKGARAGRPHRTAWIRRLQRETAQDGYRPEPAHWRGGLDPAREGRPFQTGQGATNAAVATLQAQCIVSSRDFSPAPFPYCAEDGTAEPY